MGGSMTAALNAANERANEIFRQEKIGYLDIAPVVRTHACLLTLSVDLVCY